MPKSTRELTPEGLLRSGAVLTRAGDFEYTRAELGLEGDGMITIKRTMESLQHPDTLKSLRGAPITLGHPPEGVTPDNWKKKVVGAIAGDPAINSNTIISDVLIGDSEALKRLDDGIDELSIGYDFVLGDDYATIGALRVNHVALVERGRAGSSVRVLDSLDEGDPEKTLNGDGQMEKKEMMDAVGAAVDAALDAAMKKREMNSNDTDAMKGAMKDFMSDAMKPIMEDMSKMKDESAKLTKAADAETQAKADADNRKKAEDAATALTDQVRAEERERYAIVAEALPLVDEDKRAALMQADVKAVLVTALDGFVQDPEKQSVDYLRGALSLARKSLEKDELPPGVLKFDSSKVNSTDARANAYMIFVDAQTKKYTSSGGI